MTVTTAEKVALVEACQHEPRGLLVLADWYEEMGKAVYAQACRATYENNWLPLPLESCACWGWVGLVPEHDWGNVEGELTCVSRWGREEDDWEIHVFPWGPHSKVLPWNLFTRLPFNSLYEDRGGQGEWVVVDSDYFPSVHAFTRALLGLLEVAYPLSLKKGVES